MFCSSCGTKTEKDAEFCQNCGSAVEYDSEDNKSIDVSNPRPHKVMYYGEDWSRAKVGAVATVPYFDILVDKENFYLIEFPKSRSGVFGLVIGFILLNFLGAIIGMFIGNSSARTKRQQYRSRCIDPSHGLMTDEYKKYIFIKIPMDKFKNYFTTQKNKFVVINYDNKKIILKISKEEYKRFNNFIKNHVL